MKENDKLKPGETDEKVPGKTTLVPGSPEMQGFVNQRMDTLKISFSTAIDIASIYCPHTGQDPWDVVLDALVEQRDSQRKK